MLETILFLFLDALKYVSFLDVEKYCFFFSCW